MKTIDKIISFLSGFLFRPTELEEQVTYLKSVGGGFTYFRAGKDCSKAFWSVAAHHQGPSGLCLLAHGDTLAVAVARLKMAVADADRQKGRQYVN